MNLGHTTVQQVKVRTPQLSRAQSYESKSVSDEYFTDYASDISSTNTRLAATQYETPPSRISTPAAPNHMPDSEMTLPARPTAIKLPPINSRASKDGVVRDLQKLHDESFGDMSPPTPGVDDTPFIRFAIEQLTRDEELLGHGRHGSVASDDFPIPKPPPSQSTQPTRPVQTASEPPKEPPRRPSTAATFDKQPATGGVLLPVDDSSGKQRSNLGFVPIPLRLPFLVLLVLVCLLFFTGLIFSNVHSIKSHGLYDYDGTGTPRYFLFQFLPQLLGMLVVLWLHAVQAAIYRVLPYFVLSDNELQDRVLQDMPILPANFILPDFTFFRCGEPLIGVTLSVFWLFNFTIPLLGSFYQTEWITNDGPARWRWATVQGVGWFLLVLYILLVAALLYCMYRFRRGRSSLRWDPVSIADLLPLFRMSNILPDFDRSEISESIKTKIPPRFLRLGYWATSKDSDTFYAIGEQGTPLESWNQSTWTSKEQFDDRKRLSNPSSEQQRYSSESAFSRNIHSPFVRYRWVPWYLRDSAVVAWIVISVILLITFLVVSFVNKAVRLGFLPMLPSSTNSVGFSSSDFLFSFLPSLFGMFLFLAWQPIDMFFRAVQPFANLSSRRGASAEHSLLLAYPSCWPGEVTFQALLNKDFKMAWISFISLLSSTLPVLAGGIFTAQLFTASNTVRVAATMPAYITLCVFLAIYALSYLVIWPTRKRYLPHKFNTIADLLSFIYQSPLLTERGFIGVETKADLVGRLLVSLTGDTNRQPKYSFGIYIGRDGREHLGINRLQKPGSLRMPRAKR